jgi:hypothetical protein
VSPLARIGADDGVEQDGDREDQDKTGEEWSRELPETHGGHLLGAVAGSGPDPLDDPVVSSRARSTA